MVSEGTGKPLELTLECGSKFSEFVLHLIGMSRILSARSLCIHVVSLQVFPHSEHIGLSGNDMTRVVNVNMFVDVLSPAMWSICSWLRITQNKCLIHASDIYMN